MEITKDKITEIFCIINDFKGYAEIGKSTMGMVFWLQTSSDMQ